MQLHTCPTKGHEFRQKIAPTRVGWVILDKYNPGRAETALWWFLRYQKP